MTISKAGLLSGLFGGILSGVVSFVAINSFSKSSQISSLGDAISVANTYIVFTTIIFVATTIFLAVAGLWFTYQFASSKELQTTHLMKELEERLVENKDDMGIKFIDAALKNADVSRHLQEKIENKIRQLLDEKKQNNSKENALVDSLQNSLGNNH
ncbi:MAG: hypothetical protein V4488_02830 [Pseudomonadota bacterium]